jgi:type I restriction-modification system DNA methylase subunit
MSTVREDYAAKVKLQLDELNAKVDVLEARMHEARAEVRANYRAELAKLRHQSEQASTLLAQIRTSGETSWEKMVQEMDKVRDAFIHSLNYFKSQF